MRRTPVAIRRTRAVTTAHCGLASLSLLLVLLCIAIIELDVSQAIDPEYEPNVRINQLIGAVRNTWLQYRRNAGSTDNGANGARIVVTNSTTATDDNAVTFRCRSATSTDGKFAIMTPSATYAEIAPRAANATAAALAVLIHGWFDGHDRRWFRRTANAYQRFVGGTFCTVDWSQLALRKYSMAAANTRVVAVRLERFLRQMAVPLASVTLIGHSFGAQIAGLTGGRLGGRVGRIFGLDPAGWLFTKPQMLDDAHRLDSGDAQYVQCVHTNTNLFGLGSAVQCGHQDFYPNGGLAPQPGCLRPREEGGMTLSPVTCSHYKSVQYFIASLDPANEFKGWPCASGYDGWWSGLCAGDSFDVMGVHTRNRIGGKLYLETVGRKPFVWKTKYIY